MTEGWRVDISLAYDSEGVLLTWPAKSKLLLVGLWTDVEKRAFARSKAANLGMCLCPQAMKLFLV